MDRPLDPPALWKRYFLHGAIGLFLAGIAVWALSISSASTYRVPLDRLTLATVRRAPFEDFIAVRATAAPFTTHYLTADQGGSVQKVLVEDGARVKAGQPLIVLANSALQLQVASREADVANQINALENTRLQLEDARFKYEHDLLDIEHQIGTLESNLARDKILLDGHAIAPSTYQQEKEEYAYELKLRDATIASRDAQQAVRARALAQLRETLARLNESKITARASLDGLTIRAATDGQLTALNAEVGESKAPGAILGQVDSLDRFKIIAQVDEFYLGRVVVGQEAFLTLDGRNYEARVAKIFPQVTNGSSRVDLHFAPSTLATDDPTPRGIHTGQALDIRLQFGATTRVLTVANGPFYQETGGQWVFVASADGRHATRRSVRLGRRNPDSVEVVAGLDAGERVIVSSYEAFRKADRVEIEAVQGN
ncbi:MAG TPA: HlyD family efflux transporter periplasmic adaptor subunit [Steroidobacteraceae bacterium]